MSGMPPEAIERLRAGKQGDFHSGVVLARVEVRSNLPMQDPSLGTTAQLIESSELIEQLGTRVPGGRVVELEQDHVQEHYRARKAEKRPIAGRKASLRNSFSK